MTFKIIPQEFDITVDAENAEEAIIKFATEMNTDMNIYFKAIDKNELNNIHNESDIHDKFVTNFMKNEFIETFGIDANKAEELAEDAYDLYCKGDGKTEYECIEEIYDAYLEKIA